MICIKSPQPVLRYKKASRGRGVPHMRLTIRSNLAMRTLMFCAVNPEGLVRKSDIASACNASENHLAQVINTLAHEGFIDTQRGRAGGLRLARPMAEIGIGEVLRTFEGRTAFAECFAPDSNTCPLAGACRFRKVLERAVDAFYATMDGITLADLVTDNLPLEEVLRMCSPRGMAASCG
jgi:Rrf2 family transcriptional regulator, nitric oxide-sensitive transcriptional repressor